MTLPKWVYYLIVVLSGVTLGLAGACILYGNFFTSSNAVTQITMLLIFAMMIFEPFKNRRVQSAVYLLLIIISIGGSLYRLYWLRTVPPPLPVTSPLQGLLSVASSIAFIVTLVALMPFWVQKNSRR